MVLGESMMEDHTPSSRKLSLRVEGRTHGGAERGTRYEV